MKTKLIAGLLLAGSCLFAAPRISIGVGPGAPVAAYGYYPPAPVYAAPAYVAPAYVPPPAPLVAPGQGYAWVDGYWYGVGPRRVWRAGYWAPRAAYFGPRARFRR